MNNSDIFLSYHSSTNTGDNKNNNNWRLLGVVTGRGEESAADMKLQENDVNINKSNTCKNTNNNNNNYWRVYMRRGAVTGRGGESPTDMKLLQNDEKKHPQQQQHKQLEGIHCT